MPLTLLVVEFKVVHTGEGRGGDEVEALVARVVDRLSASGLLYVFLAVLERDVLVGMNGWVTTSDQKRVLTF